MARPTFVVSALWDEEAQIFYSESDIIGLHIEAGTIEEFEEIMLDVAPGLVIENHLKPNLASTPLEDLIPSIFLKQPGQRAIA